MPPSSRWILPEPGLPDGRALAEALGIGIPAARTLISRGLADPASARRFIDAPLENLHDPLLMRDMGKAAARVRQAIGRGETILVYGDYDVDGAVAVTLLVKAVEMAGGSATWRIPHRLREGYGMRSEAVEAAAAEGVGLIVSADTGIRAAEAVRRAAELGIDVIVTDHHLPGQDLPPAFAVLNPQRRDCEYPEKNLCGAGVALKLAQALFAELGWPEDRRRRTAESFLKMAALATIADVVPITGENRVIVKHGLEGLSSARNHGLRAILEVSGITGKPSARQIAFQVAPRINAAGRMDTAEAAIELFLTSDADRARELARQLNEQNAERQAVEAAIREKCEQAPVDPAQSALVYFDEEWHRGVLGIVASRLVERFTRPVFVLGLNSEDGMAQGSGRSIPAFHLLDALDSMRELFARYGGHSYAAGVTLEASRVPEFRSRLEEYASAKLGPEDFVRQLRVDALVTPEDLDTRAASGLFSLAPFGYGNPAPVFAALDVEIAGPPIPLGERGCRLSVRRNGRLLSLKAWDFGGRASEFEAGAKVDIAFSVEEDAYSAARGYSPWCAVLKDIRPAALAAQA